MIEYDQEEQGEITSDSGSGIKVIGVGGAGANVLDRMALDGSDEAELLTLNTDVRALSTSVSSDKVQLGATLLKGMGAGGDPSLGRQAALEAVDEIREAIRGRRMVFLCVGLGGGTGSGAAPEVSRIAREEGVFLVVFATMPFSFEGERRMNQAKAALELIGQFANAVITFDNDRMGELIVPRDGVTQAFAAADKIISQSIRATMNVVFRPGIIRIGMDDLLSALRSEDSRCLFGYGVSKGDNRSLEAVEQALKCPLLDRGKLLNESRAVLVQVAGGDTMTLYEVQLVMEEISKHVGSQTQILFGTGTDKRLANSLSVTIIGSIPGPDAGKQHSSQEEDDANPGEESPVGLAFAETDAPPVSPLAAAQSYEEEEQGSDYAEAEEEVEDSVQETEPDAELVHLDQDDDDSSVFEPIEEDDSILTSFPGSEEPAYSPQPIPGREDESTNDGEEDFDLRNPIARAMAGGQGEGDALEPITPKPVEAAAPGSGEASVDRVQAVTDSSQTISLSRMVSSGNTGKIKARPSAEDSGAGPVLPSSRPPSSQEEARELSEEARQQQEMLHLEPVSGATKGRFAKTDPTIVDGEDLDVPTFLRKK